jgi:hypothetical protein
MILDQDQDQNLRRRPNGLGFRLRRVTWKSRKSHHPQVTKGACSWFGPSFVGVPSLRSRSVGPPPSAIHGGGRLSRHPCRSAHGAGPAFSLHPSRVWWCLGFLRLKIKSRSEADQKQVRSFPAEASPTVRCGQPYSHGMHALLLVGLALAGNRPVQALTDLRPEQHLWETRSRSKASRLKPVPQSGGVNATLIACTRCC